MEEELIQNMERLRPQEQKEEVISIDGGVCMVEHKLALNITIISNYPHKVAYLHFVLSGEHPHLNINYKKCSLHFINKK